MLRPSYSELMDILNQDAATDNKITSRYSIVIAAAKRARQIIDGAPCSAAGLSSDKAVTIAINEILNGKIKIDPECYEEDSESNGWYGQVKNRQAQVISEVSIGRESEILTDKTASAAGYEHEDEELFGEEAGNKSEKRFDFTDDSFDEEFAEEPEDFDDEYEYEKEPKEDDFDYGEEDAK